MPEESNKVMNQATFNLPDDSHTTPGVFPGRDTVRHLMIVVILLLTPSESLYVEICDIAEYPACHE